MKKKVLVCILTLTLSLSIVACGKKSENKNEVTQEKPKQEQSIEEQQEEMQFAQLTKEEANKLLPELAKKTKTILIDNSYRIDENFDMKEVQVLLVSNISRAAYLINSQNEQYGKKDELVEYSTDTFTNKEILTVPYMLTNFNDKETYLFNIDFMANTFLKGKELENSLMKSVVHEGVHLILQRDLEEGKVSTVEEMMWDSRAEKYPVDSEARIYRNQNLYYYKKALQSENQEDKIENIKMGNYFYKKYLDMNDEHKNETAFDKIEGQAQYLEYRGVSILNNLDKDENILKLKTKKTYLNEYMDIKEDGEIQIDKNGEFYAIGSLAYANVYDMGHEKELNYGNPLEYLLDKYGYTENEGNKELSSKVKNYYDEINNNLKTRIDSVENKLKDDKYIKIKIPVLLKYTENSSITYEDISIQYNYNNGSATIDKISKEIRIGDNRIKLNSVEVLTPMDDSENLLYVFVPKEDVEINKEKLTVQTKEVQIYDAKFIIENGVYKLVE